MPTYKKQQFIDAALATKGRRTLAARHIGCSYNTVMAYIEKYPDVAEAFDIENEKMGDAVDLALYDEAINKRNIQALIFLAKTLYKDRGYSERTEVTGKDGGAIILKTGMSLDEL